MLVNLFQAGLMTLDALPLVIADFTKYGEITDRVSSCSHNKPKTIGAYLIYHIATKKCYVGSHADLYARRYQHDILLKKQKHHSKEFQKAFNADPQITAIMIVTHDREKAYDIEQLILDKFLSQGLLFNTASDARVFGKNAVVSEETRNKLSIAGKGKKQSDDWIQKRTSHMVGRKLPAETVEKIREKAKLRGINPEMTQLAKERISKPIMVDGIRFDSMQDVCQHFKMARKTVRKRLNSNEFNWHFADKKLIKYCMFPSFPTFKERLSYRQS